MNPKYNQAKPPPWKDGGMAITQFESGMIRAEQSYLVPTNDAADFMPSFPIGGEMIVSVPTEDGAAYIYPLPAMQDLNNGFTRIAVTAYGRKPGAGGATMIERTYEVQAVTKVDLVDLELVFSTTQNYLFPLYRITRTTRQSDPPFLPDIESLRDRDAIYRESDQQVIDPTVEFGDQKTQLFSSIQRSPSTGYGEMQEEVFFVRFRPAEIDIPIEE